MSLKKPVNELIRLALIYAEQDRASFAQANHPGTPERRDAQDLAKQFRELRLRRYGRTAFDVMEADTSTKTIDELKGL